MRASLFLLAFAGAAMALPKITRKGKYLYGEDGNRFFLKGVSYQEAGTLGPVQNEGDFPEPIDFVDPLADAQACARDIPNLQKLTVNAIRVYSVDARLDHSECMKALDAAGIYTIIDLALPVNGSITREQSTWTTNLLDLYLGTIDAFSKYDNVIAYNIGNEVVKDVPSTAAAPFIKAAARDIKAYLKSINSPALVGYASTDGSGWRDPLADFLTCDKDETSIDLYGLNNYRWCGSSGSVASSYQESLTSFANLPVAAYFSEYGCITGERPRPWTEVEAIYTDPDMAQVYSGGVAFSYFPTNDDFGMTTLSGNTITTTDEFDNLAKELSKITSFINTPAQSAATQPPFPTCPSEGDSWMGSTKLPPTPSKSECDCTWKAAPCVFSPKTSNEDALFGELFAEACTRLGGAGGSCDDISANGTTGTYGRFASCDGATKLTHVFSEFYLATSLNAQSCNFAGNATINDTAPTNSAAIESQLTSCFSAQPDVFTPPAPTETPAAGTTTRPSTTATNSNGNSNGNNNNGAASLWSQSQAFAIIATGIIGTLGGLLVL